MYTYFFHLSPSKSNSNIVYTDEKVKNMLNEAITAINNGLAFSRDGKTISINNIDVNKIELTLSCKTALTHSARSLSALTRYLTTYYSEYFEPYVYNKTLFNMKLISQESHFGLETNEISDTDLLKGVIDILYTYTTTTKKEADLRIDTINQMKDLIKPFLSKLWSTPSL